VHKILSKLVDECWRYSKPKQCHFRAWLKRSIFGVHGSQGSAETLVRRGAIKNYQLIAYSFSNTSAKNYKNRLMCIEVIVCNVSVVFWDTVYSMLSYDVRRKTCRYCTISKWLSINLLQCLQFPFLYSTNGGKTKPPNTSIDFVACALGMSS